MFLNEWRSYFWVPHSKSKHTDFYIQDVGPYLSRFALRHQQSLRVESKSNPVSKFLIIYTPD